MSAENAHVACVEGWLERAGENPSADQLAGLFQQAFAALWKRAHRTLGEVTLTAIADRVLYTVAEQYPAFAALELEDGQLQSPGRDDWPGSQSREELVEAIRFVLVEFLTVLGSLTADILTPALHAELSNLQAAAPASMGGAPHAASQKPPGDEGESEP